jgi:hypothetical protein
MQVTAIVPRLAPAIDGVGDYALQVALQLRDGADVTGNSFDVDTNFLIGEPSWNGSKCIEGFAVSQVSDRTSSQLLNALKILSPQIILLHYVGYGYAKRGCPNWLIAGLQKWRQANADRRLVTMFHELYAPPQPWTSQFFTSPIQKYLFQELANLSDRVVTSRESYADIIGGSRRGKLDRVPHLPIFSNVGEPDNVLPLAQRKRQIVVFGSPNWRARAYQQSRASLERICNDLEIAEIFDIGKPLAFDIPEICGISVSCLGIRSAAEISDFLAGAIVGFLDYPVELLAKSGIFAAYCAHRILPVGISSPDRKYQDGLEDKHICLADRYEKIDLLLAQAIADNAYTWYKSHRLAVHAQTFADGIKGVS